MSKESKKKSKSEFDFERIASPMSSQENYQSPEPDTDKKYYESKTAPKNIWIVKPGEETN